MRPKAVQLTATTTSQSEKFGPALRDFVLINDGPSPVFLDFDKDVSTTTGVKINAGATVSMNADFIKLYYITESGTAKLYIIKIIQ